MEGFVNIKSQISKGMFLYIFCFTGQLKIAKKCG